MSDNLGCKRRKAFRGVLNRIRAMAMKDVLALLDAEIATLKEARQLLQANSTRSATPRNGGRPRKAETLF
jgi:hypothetical protein